MPRGKANEAASKFESNAPKKRKSNNPGGRPNDPTAAELEAKIDEYFAECDEKGRFPTESGMLLFLGLVGKKREDYLRKPKYKDVWETARDRRIDWLENQMVTNPRCAQGCMNALKQEKNGGYTDRNVVNDKSASKELKINLTGVGGKEAAG